jgi:hypothetical protein
LRKINKWPLLEGNKWTPEQFNLSKVIMVEALRPDYLLSHRITKCPDPKNSTKQIFCYKFSHIFDFLHKIIVTFPDKTRNDFGNILKILQETLSVDVSESERSEAVENLIEFFEAKSKLNQPGRQIESITLKISEINRVLFPHSNDTFDWLQIINKHGFLKKSFAKNDEMLFIEDKKVISSILNDQI